jgi:hypothetical protein
MTIVTTMTDGVSGVVVKDVLDSTEMSIKYRWVM